MSPTSQTRPTRPTTTYATDTQPSGSPLVEELDAILDEIDIVLEESTVVADYRQKGGE